MTNEQDFGFGHARNETKTIFKVFDFVLCSETAQKCLLRRLQHSQLDF